MSIGVGHGVKFSRWACRLTIRAMLLPKHLKLEQLNFALGDDDAEEPERYAIRSEVPQAGNPWDAPSWIYLHTLTFADPVPPYAEARKRWNSFQTNVLNAGHWFGVCVPQWGDETKRLHFHLVTTTRPDAKEWWATLAKYGFARYNVRRRPCWRVKPSVNHPGKIHEAAWYLARYVSRKTDWPEELKGGRSWSVFGAKRFPHPPCAVRDVRITEKCLTVIPESPKPFADWSEWRLPGDPVAIRYKLRPDATSDGQTIMREITPAQAQAILKLLATGDIVGIGEYRFCGVETKEMFQYSNGQKTANKETRVIVSHKVDFGVTCERREFDDLLPSGSDAKSVTPPAKNGDLVAVSVDSLRAFQGGTNYKGRITKL
jgi:hypothetical protein